ncbi:MAG: hypothetical protein LBU18_04795 [Treponema sp.]|nr:hypothetical protein [Treponema sp.]
MKLSWPESGGPIFPAGVLSSGGALLRGNKVLPSKDGVSSVKKIPLPKLREQSAENQTFREQPGPGILREDSRPETSQKQSELLTRLTRSLNLPLDALSSAFISFALHFSLPLDPVLLARLRRGVLSLPKFRESSAMAAAAAAGKGLELSPEALERYTAAIDPDARRKQNNEDSPGGGSESSGEDKYFRFSFSGIPDAGGLRKIRDTVDKNEPLLSILNSIPGKDGEHWLVYPFQIEAGGKRFLISVRIADGNGKEDVTLAVDAAGEDRRWLFVMKRPVHPQRRGPEPSDAAPLKETMVSLWPPPGLRERKILEKEIFDALGEAGGRVILRDNESLLMEFRDEALPAINEEI